MAKLCLYLDVDDNGISAAIQGPESRVCDVRYEELPDPGGDADDSLSPFRSALEHLAGEMDISGCGHAMVLIPSAWVWFRHTSLPFNNEKKISQVLPLELAPRFPGPEADFLLDFHILESRFEEDQYLVFSAALAEEKMKDIFTSLSALGLYPRVVAPRGYAQAMAVLAGSASLTDFLHINLTFQDMTLTLVKDSRPLAVRSFGTEPPAQGLDGGDSEFTEHDINLLAGRISMTLTGAGLRAGLEKEAFTGLPILLAAPDTGRGRELAGRLGSALESMGQKIPVPRAVELIEQAPWPMTIPPDAGLPFLFNFCVGPYKADSFFIKYKKQLIACMVLACMVFSLGVAGLHRQSRLLENRIDKVKQASLGIYLKAFPNVGSAPVQAPLLLMESKVKQARKTNSRDPGQGSWKASAGPRVLDLIHSLSARIPATVDMEVTRLVFNHGRLILTGSTGDFNNVDTIKGLMEGAPQFKSVSINSAKADKTGRKVQVKFIVEI